MATIRKLRDKYQVIIRKGIYKHKPLVRSFEKKTLASQWATKIESEIDAGEFFDNRKSNGVVFNDLLDRYTEEYISTLSQNTQYTYKHIINPMKVRFKDKSLSNMTTEYIYSYAVKRLETIKPDTLIKELNVLAGVFKFCRAKWGIQAKEDAPKFAREKLNMLGHLKGANVERQRRIDDDEYQKIRRFQTNRFNPVKFAFLFAIETGMRRSEIVSMQWSRVDWQSHAYYLEKEKSDHTKKSNIKGRIVPLTNRAIAILRLVRYLSVKRNKLNDTVWVKWNKPESMTAAMTRFRKLVGIENISVHSFRHEFGSAQADADVDIRISSAAMGHRDLRSIKRYTNPNMLLNVHKIKGRK